MSFCSRIRILIDILLHNNSRLPNKQTGRLLETEKKIPHTYTFFSPNKPLTQNDLYQWNTYLMILSTEL